MPCSYQRPAAGWRQADETFRPTTCLVHQLLEKRNENGACATVTSIRGQKCALMLLSPSTVRLLLRAGTDLMLLVRQLTKPVQRESVQLRQVLAELGAAPPFV